MTLLLRAPNGHLHCPPLRFLTSILRCLTFEARAKQITGVAFITSAKGSVAPRAAYYRQELQTRRDVLPIEEAILRQSFPEIFNNTSLGPNPPFNLEKTQLTLCLIGQRRFVEAMNLISSALPVPADLNVVDAFNYGMALWGNSGRNQWTIFLEWWLAMPIPDSMVA